jgi:hypothetical protein
MFCSLSFMLGVKIKPSMMSVVMLNVAVPKAKYRQIQVKTDKDKKRQRKIVKYIERRRETVKDKE